MHYNLYKKDSGEEHQERKYVIYIQKNADKDIFIAEFSDFFTTDNNAKKSTTEQITAFLLIKVYK